MQKAAATADEAGLSFEWLGAYIATISEKTRQAPEVIGTSLNSIMSRLQSIKQKGYNEEDETQINDISKALKNIDVAIMDNEGNWRDMSDIFMDIAMQWGDLDDKTRSYIGTTMAGTRQKNYFLTLMNDLSKVTDETGEASRAMELYEGAMNAAGSAAEKYAVYEESVTAANDRMKASLEKLYSLFSSDFLKGIYDVVGNAAEGIYDIFDDTVDYTPTISFFQDQYTWIEKLRDEYVQLMNTKNRTEDQDNRMKGILNELTGGNRILADTLKTSEGNYISATDAVEEMNKELERNLKLFRGYSQLSLDDQINDVTKINKALDSWAEAKEIPKLDKLFADLASFQGIDLDELDKEAAADFVNGIANAQKRKTENVSLPSDKLILDAFFPDGWTMDEEMFKAFQKFEETFKENYTQGIQRIKVDTSAAEAKNVSKAFTDNIDAYLKSLSLTDAFEDAPKKTQKALEKMAQEVIDSLTEEDFVDEDGNQRTGEALLGIVMKRMNQKVQGYLDLIEAAQDLSEDTGLLGIDDIASVRDMGYDEEIADLQKMINEYNAKNGTSKTLADIITEAINPKGLKESEQDIVDLQTKIDNLYKSVRESIDGANLQSKRDGGWAAEVKQLGDALNEADPKRIQGIVEGFAKLNHEDPEYFKAMAEDLDGLEEVIALFSDGDITDADINKALEIFNNRITYASENGQSAAEAIKSVKEALTETREEMKVENAKENNFLSQTTDLAKFLPTKQSLEDYMVTAYSGGNVDLTNRPTLKIDGIDVDKDSVLESWGVAEDEIATLLTTTMSTSDWDDLQFDQDVVVNLTPILPDGTVLTEQELNDYFFELAEKSKNAKDFIEADKVENGGLGILLYAENVEGELDDAIAQAEVWAEKLHEIHDLYYGGLFEEGDIDTEGITKYIDSLDESMQEALFEYAPELKEALALLNSDDLAEQEEGARLFEEAILAMADAWNIYAENYMKAQELEIDDEKGLNLMKNLSEAYDTGGIEGYQKAFAKMSDEEQEWVKSNSKAHDQIIKAWSKGEDGIEDATKAMKKFNREYKKMELDKMVESGEIWQEVADIADDSVDTETELLEVYGKFNERLTETADAQGYLNYAMSSSDKNSDEYKEAIDSLNSVLPFTINSEEDLALAQQYLASQMGVAGMSSEYLLNMLAAITGINFSSDNWESELQNLANSGNAAAGVMLGLIATLRAIDKTSVSVNNGVFSVNNLGNVTGVKLPSSSRSSGGGGSSGGSSGSGNEMSEIEKMLDLMEQIQDIREHQMDMISATRDYYEQQGYYTTAIKYYEDERDALEENNEIIEENVKKIESLLFAKQKEVAAMSTSDKEYEQAAKDLEALQDAHQEYSLALIENKTAIEEFNESIDDMQKEIRDMEIDLRETILEAIEDREELNERMLQGTIDVENEILDVITKRYEKERDLAIETAEAKIEALEAESEALDEQLQKRKEAAEAEDKQLKLAQLQQQLARISADPTRKKEELELRKEIAELRDEMAWDLADQEVEAQQESIDQQITSLEDYIEQVEDYYEDLFEHPQKLLEEVKAIMAKTDEEILEFLKKNNEDYANSTEATQKDMVNSWNEMLMDMHGSIKTYWDEVEQIISGGDDAIIQFLMENSADYKAAGKLQAEAYVDEWIEQLDRLAKAREDDYQKAQSYNYETIRPSTGSSSSSNTGGSKTPSSSSNTTTTTKQYYYVAVNGNVLSSQKYESATEAMKAANALRASGDYQSTDNLSVITRSYAKGGLANFTGPAWLDGTPSAPERILSPYQTQLFEDMIATLHQIKVTVPTMPSSMFDGGANNSQAITFGDIILNVDQLAEDADYTDIANRLMEEIMDRMAQNSVVGGIRVYR